MINQRRGTSKQTDRDVISFRSLSSGSAEHDDVEKDAIRRRKMHDHFIQLTKEPLLFFRMRFHVCKLKVFSLSTSNYSEFLDKGCSRRIMIFVLSILFMCLIIFSNANANQRSSNISRSDPNRRALIIGDKAVPLHIKLFDMEDTSSPHDVFPSIDTLDHETREHTSSPEAVLEWDTNPDYGGLEIGFQYERTLRPTIAKKVKVQLRRFEEEDISKCIPVSWDHLYSPSCNMIHEFDLERDEMEYGSTYLAHGFYRDVWALSSRTTFSGRTEDMVVKTLRIAEHDFKKHAWDEILLDALIMERLTGSPRIMNTYGHCGFTVTAETIQGELEEKIVPGEGVAKQADLDKEDDLKPKNDFTVEEKLEIALTMAESIADLHGFKDGLIIHDDIQICQWLRRRSDGKIVLGDFNRATIPKWNEGRQEYCKFTNGYGFGEVRFQYCLT